MQTLTILLTRSATGEGIVRVLRDWSAAGQLGDFVWVRSATGGRREVSFKVVAGELQVIDLPTLIASEAPHRVRLVALWSDLDGPAFDMEVEAQRQAQAIAGMGLDRVVNVALNITRLERNDATNLLAIGGFFNLVLSPEDGRGPGEAARPLAGDDRLLSRSRLSAHAVATLAGLQPGLEESGLDGMSLPPGNQLTPVRVFTRLIDASEVEADLRSGTLSMADGYPLVTENGARATYVENDELAAHQQADALIAAHGQLLMSGRTAPVLQAQEKIGLFAALKLFFGYMWAALRNAPGDWARAVVASTKIWVADAATSAMFGAGSKMSVVVGGLSSTTTEKMDAVRDLADSLPQGEAGHQVHLDYSPVWRDLSAGALALLDGETHVAHLPHVQIGGARGVVRYGQAVAPSPAETFRVPDAHVRNISGVEAIAPTDVLLLRQLVQRCDATDPTDPMATAIAGTRNEALKWWAKIKRTYTVRVAERLAGEWDARLAEITAYAQILAEALKAAGLNREEEIAQRKLARWVRIILIVALVLVLATIALGALAIIGWALVGILCAAWLVSWLVGTFIAYFRGTKAVFQAKHRRQEAISKAQAAEANLRAALRDADHIADLYRLLQPWSAVLAAFVAEPLGPQSELVKRPRVAGAGHALAVQFARAEPDALRVATVAHAIRDSVFRPGWLSGSWTAFLESAARDLGTKGVGLVGNSSALYQQRAVQEDTLLPMWAHLVTQRGTSHDAGDRMWVSVVNQLRTRRAGLVTDLLGNLALDDGSSRTYEAFSSGLDSDMKKPFPNDLFEARTILEGVTGVSERWQRSGQRGLSEIKSLVEFGTAIERSAMVSRAAVEEPHQLPDWKAGLQNQTGDEYAAPSPKETPIVATPAPSVQQAAASAWTINSDEVRTDPVPPPVVPAPPEPHSTRPGLDDSPDY